MNYKTYKRGQVVTIEVKNAVGNELKYKHWAIVLNKDDNKNNGVITIVPLTSKSKPYYLDLGYEVSISIFENLDDTCKKMTSPIRHEVDSRLDLIDELLKVIKSLMFDGYTDEYYNDLVNQVSDLHNNNLVKIETMRSITKTITKLRDSYLSKTKSSYAMVRNITTISKSRILPLINSYDPLGTIKVSSFTLDKIDDEIKQLFTK